MKVRYRRRNGLLKYQEAEIDLGYIHYEDYNEAYNTILDVLKEIFPKKKGKK